MKYPLTLKDTEKKADSTKSHCIHIFVFRNISKPDLISSCQLTITTVKCNRMLAHNSGHCAYWDAGRFSILKSRPHF